MAINFPSNPSTNDTHEVNGRTYIWTGEKWRRRRPRIEYTPPTMDVSNDFTAGSALKVDSDNSSVGIGTMTPNADDALTVSGHTTITDGVVVDTNTLVVDATNNRVGIGTTSPDIDLHIQTANNTMAHFESTDGEALIAFSDNSSTGNWYDRRLGVIGEDMTFITDNTRRMTILDDGKVGIGTTSPTYKLDIEDGTVAAVSLNDSGGTVGASTNSRVIFEAGGSTAGEVGFLNTGVGILSLTNQDGPIYLTTASADGILFRPNATEAMRITSDGNVGIGRTSPTYKLDINAVSDGNILRLKGADDTLNFTVSAGDFSILNSQQSNGLVIYDGSGGVEIWYSGSSIIDFDSGGIVARGTLNMNSNSITASGGITGLTLSDGISGSNFNITGVNQLEIADPGEGIVWKGGASGDINLYVVDDATDDILRTNGNLTVDGVIDVNEVRGDNGSATDPSFTFTSDMDTGIYRYTTNTLGFTVGGTASYLSSNGFYLASGDWFRVQGNSGIYWQSHGGGWNMTDSTYLRMYGSKSLYLTNEIFVPNMDGTSSYNTVRFNSTTGQLMRYTSTTEIKEDITSIKPMMEYLNERSYLYDLRPVLFHEKDKPDGTNNTRREYISGFVAEEVLDIAPELAYHDINGELMSYSNDSLIPHIVAELQRLMPMVEELYGATNSDWVAPVARPDDRKTAERELYDQSAAAQALTGDPNADPLDGLRHQDDESESDDEAVD